MATLTYTTLGGIVAAAPNVASDVTTAFTQAQTAINNVEDTQYINQNNSVWRTVLQQPAYLQGGTVAGTYWFPCTGAAVTSGTTAGITYANGFLPTASDFAVTSKTTTLRLQTVLAVNGTAPGVTTTFGLYPATLSGSSGQLVYTLGAVIAGSTTAFASPGASAATAVSSSGFAISALAASTLYVVGAVTSGSSAANTGLQGTVSLQMRHV